MGWSGHSAKRLGLSQACFLSLSDSFGRFELVFLGLDFDEKWGIQFGDLRGNRWLRYQAEVDGVPTRGEVRCLYLGVSLPADLHVSWV